MNWLEHKLCAKRRDHLIVGFMIVLFGILLGKFVSIDLGQLMIAIGIYELTRSIVGIPQLS